MPITSVAIAGANANQFAQTNTCGASVAVGVTCTINVVFTPTTTGAKTATVKVTAGGGAAAQSATLSGTGIVPKYSLSPTTLAFGNEGQGIASAAKTVTLTNIGTLAVPITSITLAGGNANQFAVSSTCPAFVPVGNFCTFNVVFTPTSSGAKATTVNVTVGGGAAAQSVSVLGTGIVPTYSLSPSTLAFGNQAHGTAGAALPITLTNTGTLALPITTIAATGMFSETNTCGTSVGAGGTCTINVKFAPTSIGAKVGTVKVTAGGGAATITATLSGTGT